MKYYAYILLASVAGAGSAGAAPATQSESRVAWPTFLRTAPSPRADVVGELARGTPVAVLACAAQWCRVELNRSQGYVDERNLESPAATRTDAAVESASGCFTSVRSGYGEGQTFVYCPRTRP